jgi:hypothetical protein
MTPLFDTPGMTAISTLVVLIEFSSLIVLIVGLLSYRHIVNSHLAFFASLHHAGKQARPKPVQILFWLYLLSTLFLILCSTVVFVWQPNLF